mmetsp:Transcript_17109/g.68885  ORF Transcript_17109/g.68885 Transcript_17109/m.68885 type:complete len:397 (-) Transcript_17109:30-1220(-)
MVRQDSPRRGRLRPMMAGRLIGAGLGVAALVGALSLGLRRRRSRPSRSPRPAPPSPTPAPSAAPGTAAPTVRDDGPTRFLIFAHQRGGSHFTMGLLNSEARCKVVGEEVQNKGNVTVWSERVESVFARVAEMTRPAPRVVGFVLHHNQVWCYRDAARFEQCVVELAKWTIARRVRVVHLVREAALMMAASDYLARLGPHLSVTANATYAAEQHAFATAHPFPLTDEALGTIAALEFEFDVAHRTLQRRVPGRYHRVRYESLIDPTERDAALRDTLSFLGLDDVDDATLAAAFAGGANGLLELHPPTCASRVANWTTSQALLSNGTRAACDALDRVVARAGAAPGDGAEAMPTPDPPRRDLAALADAAGSSSDRRRHGARGKKSNHNRGGIQQRKVL